jgi:outer membrane protein
MKTICVGLIFAACLPVAFAQTNAPAARPLSLQDCLTEALKHNFTLQYQRFEPLKAQLALSSAYAGYDPSLSLSGSHDHNNSGAKGSPNLLSDANSFNSDIIGSLPTGTTYDLGGNVSDTYGTTGEGSGGQIGIGITQPLLKNFWIDSTRLGISAAKNSLHLSEQDLRQKIIDTVTSVENAYYELIYARENLQVQKEALTLAEKQLADDKVRVQVGTMAESGGTIEQDEAQVAQNHASLINAQYSLVTAENTLKNLITENYLQWHDVAIEPTGVLTAERQVLDVQESWNRGMKLRPDLTQAKLSVEQQGIQLKYTRNQIFPELDLKASYGYNGAGREFHNTFDQYNTANRPYYTYGAALSVPLGNTKARNDFKTAKATEQQLLLSLKQTEQNIMVDIDNAVKKVRSTWESVDATQKARIYAEAALKAEQGKYTVGKSTTFTVLQLQNNLTSARSQEIRALADYNEALSNLAQQEGSTLEHHHLDVQSK